MTLGVDFVVIGAGIAGVSAAWALAEHGRVLVLEAEAQAGYHATGRSAALFHLIYGGPGVQPLSRASLEFFRAPPAGFTEVDLLRTRGILIVARSGQEADLGAKVAEAPDALRVVTAGEARQLWPALRPGYVSAAAWDGSSADIDVDALHRGFIRGLTERGSTLRTGERVDQIERRRNGWRIRTPALSIECGAVVNAAGAWADENAVLAGVKTLGLRPKRRTAALIDAPADARDWPMLIDAAESFYAKPSAGRMLLSPAEETDMEAHDAAADDLALAEGVERLEAATTLTVHRKPLAWAGLRTFTPDRLPAVGEAPDRCGFFWLAGQGGFGVQTAPALARLLASEVTGAPLPARWRDVGLSPDAYRPARLLSAQVSSHAPQS
ncbi:MAG TPA: FAD-binding oxidoreductase [Caulobacter sp.]|nr:FAD-binding oxidoreductase [Caulobacter sp.]